MKNKVLLGLITLALLALPVCFSCTLITSTTQPTLPTQGIAPLVSTQWLAMNMDVVPNLVILDVRAPDNYAKGHIPTAKNLPAPWFWTFEKDKKGRITYGTWKDADVIKEMALAVLGEDASEEIIVYCGVGGYASPVWFALTQMIGYTNAKIYDGSMQEWTADAQAPVVKYRYQ